MLKGLFLSEGNIVCTTRDHSFTSHYAIGGGCPVRRKWYKLAEFLGPELILLTLANNLVN